MRREAKECELSYLNYRRLLGLKGYNQHKRGKEGRKKNKLEGVSVRTLFFRMLTFLVSPSFYQK